MLRTPLIIWCFFFTLKVYIRFSSSSKFVFNSDSLLYYMLIFAIFALIYKHYITFPGEWKCIVFVCFYVFYCTLPYFTIKFKCTVFCLSLSYKKKQVLYYKLPVLYLTCYRRVNINKLQRNNSINL